MKKYLLVLVMMLLMLASCSKKVEAGEINLSWEAPTTSCGTTDPYPVEDFGGYKVFIGTTSGLYDFRTDDVGDVTTYRVTGLDVGINYCMVVQSYSIDNQFCSANPYSSEVCADAKAIVPTSSGVTLQVIP